MMDLELRPVLEPMTAALPNYVTAFENFTTGSHLRLAVASSGHMIAICDVSQKTLVGYAGFAQWPAIHLTTGVTTVIKSSQSPGDPLNNQNSRFNCGCKSRTLYLGKFVTWAFLHGISQTSQECCTHPVTHAEAEGTYLIHKQLLTSDSRSSGGREAPGNPILPMWEA